MSQNQNLIYHSLRGQLGLSCNEYCVADTIRVLAAEPTTPIAGWCTIGRGAIGQRPQLSRQSVIEILKTLLKKGLVEENEQKHLRPTAYFSQLVTDKQSLEESNQKW